MEVGAYVMNWEDIRKEYESSDITLKALAEKYNIKDTTLRSRKNREKWQRNNATQHENVATKKKRNAQQNNEIVESLVESDGLTDKQRLFCLYYVKTFNQTMAAIKAGYSPDRAHVTGSELVRNRKVAEEIRRIKSNIQQGVFVDAMDVLNKYIKIAFTDITDYLTFGQKEVEVMGAFGPLKDEDGNQIMKVVNYVEFNESSMVDGSVISEVKQGKDGVSIRLEDKMKALDKLSLYFDLFPDKFKRDIEKEKLKLAQRKVNGEDEEEYEDDGFLEALDGKDVNWDEET